MVPQPSSENAPYSKSSSDSPGIVSPLEFVYLTLFPEKFDSFFSASLIGKARERGLVRFQPVQIRDFAQDRHRTVDDTPYGGGEGMLMKPDVLLSAWNSARQGAPERTRTLLLSPQGRLFTQSMARELSTYSRLILICGHYEGLDERFIERCVDEEVSIGDYVLTGGELPAMVLTDAITRLIPGVVGNERSITEDSLERGLLKYPQYTRPREFMNKAVPEVLLSGNHGEIELWRRAQSIERTERKRPDLLTKP